MAYARTHPERCGRLTSLFVYVNAINAECNDSFKGRRGRPCITLLDTIRSDLKRRKISNSLRSISDFENLRVIALDRVKWKSFEKM